MKNYDLIWARENAGLTQEQAAKLLDVTRRTLSRWETGAGQIPPRKMSRFKKLVGADKGATPPRREYTVDGYPAELDRARFGNATPMSEARDRSNPDQDHQAEFAALKKLEGEEYEVRAKERHRLFWTKYFRTVCENSYPDKEVRLRVELERYEEETARIEAARKIGSAEPKRYGRLGYPLGFSPDVANPWYADEGGDWDPGAEEVALKKIERDDYKGRARERWRLFDRERRSGTKEEMEEQEKTEMDKYDAETIRIEAWEHAEAEREVLLLIG